MKGKILYSFGFLLIALIGLFGFVVGSRITIIPKVQAQSTCTPPTQVQGVTIAYPNCVGTQCDFTQAGCSWSALAGASQYQVKITEVETGTVVTSPTEPSTTTSMSFPVSQSNTYGCSVSAVDSCGDVGTAGTVSLYCKIQSLVPTNTSVPTAIPPKPTVPATGSTGATVAVIAGSAIMLVVGAALFII